MHTLFADVAVTTTSYNPTPAIIGGLIGYLIGALALYGIFTKAGEAGWQGFIPIWNTIILIKISGKPIWWIILLLIPVVNIIFGIIILHGLSTSFGHGAGFTVGLIFLSIIFYYILWLGSSTYRGPGGGDQVAPTGYATA